MVAGTRKPGRWVAFAAGVFVSLLLLELGLRVVGWGFFAVQRAENRRALAGGGERVVLCVGESTTALGGADSWPSQLEDALNAGGGPTYAVVNGGIPGGTTAMILGAIEDHLDRYQPQLVVAMMGANESENRAIPEAVAMNAGRGFPYNLKAVELAQQVVHQLRGPPTGALASPGAQPPPTRETTEATSEFDALIAEGRWERDALHFGAAERAFRDAAALDPKSELPYVELAFLFTQEGDPRRRELVVNEGIERCGACPALQLELAKHHDLAGNVDQAAEAYWRFMEIAPDDESVLLPFGQALFQAGRCEEAVGLMETGLARTSDPQQAVSYRLLLAQCLMKLGRLEDALPRLETLWAERWESRQVFILLLDLHERMDDEPRAVALIEDARGRVDDDPAVQSRIALHYRARGDLAAANAYAMRDQGLRTPDLPDVTRRNYRELREILYRRGISLVAVQYPTLNVRPIEELFADDADVVIVDNGPSFREALAATSYDALFWDMCYGDFGHATREGNRLLSENVAQAIQQALPAPSE